MHAPLDALGTEFLQVSVSADPLSASVFGIPGADGLLPDLSEEGEAEVAARFSDLADRAEQIDPAVLDDDDRVSRAVLVHTARQRATTLTDRHAEFSVSGFLSPVTLAVNQLTKTTLGDAGSHDDYLSRLSGLPTMLSQAGARGLAAAARGTTPARSGVEQLRGQLAAYLATPLDDDPMLGPAKGTPVHDRARALLADEVRPAYAAYLATVEGPMLEASRPDDRCGIAHVSDGDGIYARAAAIHTTTTRTPEEIHQLGLDLCEALRDEYAELGQRVFGLTDFAAITDRLRNDPALRYSSAEEILEEARQSLVRAEQAVGDWFGTVCKAACTVEAMNDLEAPTSVMAYYRPPGGDRPGQHWVNTYQPETRTRYEYETLAFHESVPGHHLQFAVAQEITGVPEFRRYQYVTAFGEGWGLYTERLCDEMGLYSSDLARFGMLSFDSWRACRLVVDTGMHHHGWSRQQAIDFMLANSALNLGNIVNEVDRYIAWPGQALAYMIGRLELQQLRRDAEARLGSAFDIRGFHDAVLLNGSVPLTVLADEVDRWVGSRVAS